MKRSAAVVLGIAGLVGTLVSGQSSATVLLQNTCTNVLTTDQSGSGTFTIAALTAANTCVQQGDKLFGDFSFGSTFTSDFSVVFSLNTVGLEQHHQIAFNGPYASGSSYSLSFTVEIDPLPSSNYITALDADFTQTKGGPSTLVKTSTPPGDPAGGINETKTGPIPTPTSVFEITYPIGTVQQLAVSETLTDNGTISSITDTVIETTLLRTPEPATVGLLGLGLAGLGWVRRRRVH